MTLFGIALSVGELIALLTGLISIVTAYAHINNKLSFIISRNVKADERMDELERDFLSKLTETRAILEARFVLAENRISGQEIRDARTDEKFNFLQGQLARLINLTERITERDRDK